MSNLELLSQLPVLKALVPHLNKSAARSLFSSCSRLHRVLKHTAHVRYAVWLLEGINRERDIIPTYWFKKMLEDIVYVGDLGAMTLACELPAPVHSHAYRKSMDNAFIHAIAYGKIEVVEMMIGRQCAKMTERAAANAVIIGNMEMIKYLMQHHPNMLDNINAKIVHLDPTGEHMYQVKQGNTVIYTMQPPSPNHRLVAEWMITRA